MILKKQIFVAVLYVSFVGGLLGCVHAPDQAVPTHDHLNSYAKETWLAGDHHVHSEYSVKWAYHESEKAHVPPEPILGGDAIYLISKNVEMAHAHGLDWMVTTDHGGPLHSKLNLEKAYPDVVAARKAFPDMVLFYGMEFDTPGAEHSSLIMPHTHDEAERLFEIESQYNKREPFPKDGSEDLESRMDHALEHMRDMPNPPVIIANHPSRTKKNGRYTKVEPSELRRWNTIAPNVAVGMEGAPGHQASTQSLFVGARTNVPRAAYKDTATLGGEEFSSAFKKEFSTTIATEKSMEFRMIIDRSSVELFVNGGRRVLSSCFFPEGNVTLDAFSNSRQAAMYLEEMNNLSSCMFAG